MPIDVTKVLVGAPDQKTTGAISDAPVGSKLPTDAVSALDKAFQSSGYCSEDGVSLTMDKSTTDIKDWSGKVIRKLLESFDGTLSWSEMQMSYESLCHAFGEANVEKTDATDKTSLKITVKIRGDLPPERSWTFNMKDGNTRVRIVVPRGQVTAIDEVTFVSNDAVKLPITLTTYPDDAGYNMYMYIDDGVNVEGLKVAA